MGRTYWITGLAGAGKTTVGKLLYEKLKEKNKATIFLDGDELRQIFGNDLGYKKEDRLKSAMRNAHICELLSRQEIDVVCCTISMFNEVREWNRDHIRDYVEIYLQVSMDILKKRNKKNLYGGNEKNVVGIDIDIELPQRPDIILNNNGDKSPQELIEHIWEWLEKEGK